MKVLTSSIIALLPLGLFGVYAPIPEAEQGQLLSVSLQAGISHDDNIFGTAVDEIDSMIYTLSPSVGFNMALGDQGFVFSKYALDALYFENRPTEDKLYNHTISSGLSYTFSERFTLNINDELKSIDNPESSLTLGLTDLQADQSFWDHNLSLEGLYTLSEKSGLVFTSSLYAINYDNSILARLIDLRRNELALSTRYAFLPELTLVGEVRYQDIIYDVGDLEKGSDSIFLLVGADHNLSEKLIIQSRVGLESRNRNLGNDKDSFTGNLVGVYSYKENSALTFGLNHKVREASNTVNFIDSTVTGLFLSMQHDITGANKLFWSGTYIYEAVKLNGRATVNQADIDEHVIRLGVSVTYKIKENLRLITSFDHDNIRSDDSLREQKRNRVSFSIQYQFGGIQ